MARTPTAIPQIPIEGEVIKGKKGINKNAKAKDLAAISDEQWEYTLAHISSGVPVDQAIEATGISRSLLDGVLRANTKMKAQWEDAKLASMRLLWDVDTIEEALVQIAMGATVKQACEHVLRGDEAPVFYKLVLKDPIIKEMYDEARMIQAEKMAIDDVIEISDDSGNDETWDGKGNSAAVNRSRLKVDSRKWIAGRLHWQRFGDKIQQEVNANVVVDHAARLEAARKRKAEAAKRK